ncbi:hypothetical protein KEM52_002085 [Ascosphaera acerosa]|nr:hypothetical protein KEM52_002085 [Ascosphaera acerosa]
MPYIPPAPLATTLSRSAAFRYGRHNSDPSVPTMTEPSPPRQHRRSPSLNIPLPITSPQPATKPVPSAEPQLIETTGGDTTKRSTYPWKPSPGHSDHVVQAGIPVGAILSPTDSRSNSSEEDDKELAGLRSPDLAAPTPSGLEFSAAVSERLSTRPLAPHSPPESPQPSRLLKSCLRTSRTAPQTPDESETECDTKTTKMVRKKSGELVRPALRMRPRPASVPGTPTYIKAVHFDAKLEHIRHFLQVDKPTAVSADTSPVDNYDGDNEFPFGSENRSDDESDRGETTVRPQPGFEWDARIANYPSHPESRKDMVVRLERIFLTPDNKNLVGVVSVANLAFHKSVVARFTFDYWKTTSEVVAEYNPDVRRKKRQTCHGVEYDRFDFSISLADQANLQSRQLFVCIRYCVGQEEHWDNNNWMNYNINFSRRYNKHGERLQAEKHSLGAPRSRRAVSASACMASPAADWVNLPALNPIAAKDSAGSSIKTSSSAVPSTTPRRAQHSAVFSETYNFSNCEPRAVSVEDEVGVISPTESARASPPSAERQLSLETKTAALDLDDDAPEPTRRGAAKAFATRYDFGASLSAAMQPPTGDRQEVFDPVTSSMSSRSSRGIVAQSDKADDSTVQPVAKASTVNSSETRKPYHQSALYKELVDRYCFYGTGKPATSASVAETTAQTSNAVTQRPTDMSMSGGSVAPVAAYQRVAATSGPNATPGSGTTTGASFSSLQPRRTASPTYTNRGVSPILRTPSPFSPTATPSPPLTAAAHSPSFASLFGESHADNVLTPFALPRPLYATRRHARATIHS